MAASAVSSAEPGQPVGGRPRWHRCRSASNSWVLRSNIKPCILHHEARMEGHACRSHGLGQSADPTWNHCDFARALHLSGKHSCEFSAQLLADTSRKAAVHPRGYGLYQGRSRSFGPAHLALRRSPAGLRRRRWRGQCQNRLPLYLCAKHPVQRAASLTVPTPRKRPVPGR